MKKKSKIILIIANVLLYVFVAIGLFSIIITIFSKKSVDGTASVFGKQLRIVETASMEKNAETDVSNFEIKDIPVGSMVFIDLVPEDKTEAEAWYSELKVGDVLTFKYYIAGSQYTITHRIIKIEDKDGKGYIISLRGDNVVSKDSEPGGILVQRVDTTNPDSFHYVIGKVTGQSKVLGFIITSLKKPVVLFLIIIVPCLAVIILEVIKIVSVLRKDKNKEIKEEKERQTDEIAELKKQIEKLQQERGGGAVGEKPTANVETTAEVVEPTVETVEPTAEEIEPTVEEISESEKVEENIADSPTNEVDNPTVTDENKNNI